jgi:hypothetical protein
MIFKKNILCCALLLGGISTIQSTGDTTNTSNQVMTEEIQSSQTIYDLIKKINKKYDEVKEEIQPVIKVFNELIEKRSMAPNNKDFLFLKDQIIPMIEKMKINEKSSKDVILRNSDKYRSDLKLLVKEFVEKMNKFSNEGYLSDKTKSSLTLPLSSLLLIEGTFKKLEKKLKEEKNKIIQQKSKVYKNESFEDVGIEFE